MATYTHNQVVVWDNLGGAVRIARSQRIDVTDPDTGTTPAGLEQGGVAVSFLTSDADGHLDFGADVDPVTLTHSSGWTRTVYADTSIGVDGVPSALAAPTPLLIDGPANYWSPLAMPGSTAVSGGLHAADSAHLGPVSLPAMTLDRAGIYISTAQAATTCRFGLYEDAGGHPGALLWGSGSIDVSTTGEKIASGLALSVPAGTYWVLIVGSGTSFRYNGWRPTIIPGLGGMASGFNHLAIHGLTWASGLPADLTSTPLDRSNFPNPAAPVIYGDVSGL